MYLELPKPQLRCESETLGIYAEEKTHTLFRAAAFKSHNIILEKEERI